MIFSSYTLELVINAESMWDSDKRARKDQLLLQVVSQGLRVQWRKEVLRVNQYTRKRCWDQGIGALEKVERAVYKKVKDGRTGGCGQKIGYKMDFRNASCPDILTRVDLLKFLYICLTVTVTFVVGRKRTLIRQIIAAVHEENGERLIVSWNS